MRHPDEGVIHSWLDGALPAEDAANVESHVAGCQQCAAAVAEARGFIAASSRILTALDDVPGHVIPVVPARKRDLRVFWRAAAAMLVVAGGSLIVLREGGQDTAVRLSTDSASLESVKPNAAANSGVEGGGIADATASVQPSKKIVPSPRRAAPATASSELSKATVDRASAAEQDFPGKTADAKIAEGTSLKLLSVERRIGESRTTYQVAPNETVTLIESQALALSEIATTGASAQQRTRAVSPMAAQAAAPPPPVVVVQPNSISWTEAATGKKLTLSGNVSLERLEQIKLSIEQERAATRANMP